MAQDEQAKEVTIVEVSKPRPPRRQRPPKPDEIVIPTIAPDGTISLAAVRRMYAANLARQPETIAEPLADFLVKLMGGVIACKEPVIAAWLETADDEEWEMAEYIFGKVEEFIAQVRTMHSENSGGQTTP